MNIYPDLSKISQITDHIYLSGIYPLEDEPELINKLNIKYILSCVDRPYVGQVHEKIMLQNPDITIMYLPYNDNVKQNLWQKNSNKVTIVRFADSVESYETLKKQINMYQNKPLIDIGYYFINQAVESNSNILIHCMAGISRSVSLIIYYFMKKYNAEYNDIYQSIRNKRSIVNPNPSFKNQLLNYRIKREKFTENDADKIVKNF